MANSSRRNNFIESLLVIDLVTCDHIGIVEHSVDYDRLFTEQFSWRPKLDGLSFNSIREDEAI